MTSQHPRGRHPLPFSFVMQGVRLQTIPLSADRGICPPTGPYVVEGEPQKFSSVFCCVGYLVCLKSKEPHPCVGRLFLTGGLSFI
jgi:hypothetical protein